MMAGVLPLPAPHAVGLAIHIILYQRTYPVPDAPVAWSLVPFAGHQRHTYPVGGVVYEAECREVRVVVPDDAKVDALRNQLTWHDGKGLTRSTAREVFDLARAGGSGFRLVRGASA